MADEKKSVASKAAKSKAKKVSKKATVKTKLAANKSAAARKATQKVAKKVTKKVARKVTKKVARKTTVTKKPAAKTTGTRKAAVPDNNENKLEQLQSLLQDNLSGLNTDKAEELAKSVWFAGLGAYSRTFDELSERQEGLQDKIHGRVETINAEGQKIFEELVTRGRELQGEAEKAVQEGRESLEDRVEEFKKRFGGGLSSFVDIPERLREAAQKIEEISIRLQKKK